MDNWGKVGVIIGVILLGATAYGVYLAYPKIEVKMVFTDENLVNSQNVEALIAKDEGKYSFTSKVCFEVKNTASILAEQLPANNFNVNVRTQGAICEDCGIGSAKRVLKAQEIETVCRNMKVAPNIEEFSIHIFSHGDALGRNLDNEFVYNCSKIEELDTQNKYNCGLRTVRIPN